MYPSIAPSPISTPSLPTSIFPALAGMVLRCTFASIRALEKNNLGSVRFWIHRPSSPNTTHFYIKTKRTLICTTYMYEHVPR